MHRNLPFFYVSRVLRPLLKASDIGYLENYIRIVAAPLICGEPLFMAGRQRSVRAPPSSSFRLSNSYNGLIWVD